VTFGALARVGEIFDEFRTVAKTWYPFLKDISQPSADTTGGAACDQDGMRGKKQKKSHPNEDKRMVARSATKGGFKRPRLS
jgi:hypothetical protein